MAKFKLAALSVNLPFGMGGATLNLNEAQVKAAWELYVEYATRIATQPLEVGAGSVREALNSLHALFGITREVLKNHGPGIAQGEDSLGAIAIRLLNVGVRPFLVEWHTGLSEFEDSEILRQQQSIGAQHRYVIDEGAWGGCEMFYGELECKRLGLLEYVRILGKLAGVEEWRSGGVEEWRSGGVEETDLEARGGEGKVDDNFEK
jgi:hypothetical protein